MKKIYSTIIVFIILINTIFAHCGGCGILPQTDEKKDVSIFSIPDVGYIKIPLDLLELQNSEYQKLAYDTSVQDYMKKMMNYNDAEYQLYALPNSLKYIFQQKGLNDKTNEAFDNYLRFIIDTSIEKEGDYGYFIENYKNNDYHISDEELLEINNYLKDEYINMLAQHNMIVTKWFPIDQYIMPGLPLVFKYIRKSMIQNNPDVLVRMIMFENNDRIHTLTLAYRNEDANKYEHIFDEILNSFTVTNIIN